MGGKPKNTDEKVREYFEEHGYEWVDGEYKNNKEKLHLRCPEGHDVHMNFHNFKSGKRCNECANLYKRSANKRLTKEQIKDFVEKNECKIIDGLDSYRSTAKSKLTIECKHGHIFTTTYASLSATNCGCPECKKSIVGAKLRHDGKLVYDDFLEHGLIPLFLPDDYRNSATPMPCLCKKHMDKGTQYRSYSDIKKSKYPCIFCYQDNNFGENAGHWQGGISTLTDRLREVIDQWKFDSLKHYDFMCPLTGTDDDLIIHHLYPFHKIVKEALDILNMDVRPAISEYSQDELNSIDDMVLKLHDKYGYGVPLERYIHDMFHSKKLYGALHNTPEQFEEFKQRWLQGEFDVTEDVGEIANG
jgi:hypothetical protein